MFSYHSLYLLCYKLYKSIGINGLFIKLIVSLKMNHHRNLCLFLCELYNIKYISYLLNISKLDIDRYFTNLAITS